MIISAFVTFTVWILLIKHCKAQTIRRIFGYALAIDLVLHGTILFMFFGTSTEGLLQAEAAGIMFSLYIRFYRRAWGYERFEHWPGVGYCWVRYAGWWTKARLIS